MELINKVKNLLVKKYTGFGREEPKNEVFNYMVYKMSDPERIGYILLAAVFLFMIGIIFFNSISLALLLSLASYYYPKYKVKDLVKKQKDELNLQFRDALYSLASALNTGISLENSFKTALIDLRVIYHDDETYILSELRLICRRLEINEPVEVCLYDLADRSGLEDIRNFADTIVICKRCGGNLVEVVRNSSHVLREKIDICNEIEVSLTRQKYEHKILIAMPIIFIGLMKFGGSGYMDPLYSSFLGYIIMAVALVIIYASYVITKKILEIRV